MRKVLRRKGYSVAGLVSTPRRAEARRQRRSAPQEPVGNRLRRHYDRHDAILGDPVHDLFGALFGSGAGCGGHAGRLAALRRHTVFVALQRARSNQHHQRQRPHARVAVPDRRLCGKSAGHSHRGERRALPDHGAGARVRAGCRDRPRDLELQVSGTTAQCSWVCGKSRASYWRREGFLRDKGRLCCRFGSKNGTPVVES